MKIKNQVLTGVYYICSLTILLIIFEIFAKSTKFVTSISDLTLQHNIIANIVYILCISTPLIWLTTSDIFENAVSIYRKALLISLALFIVSTFFPARYAINTAAFFFVCVFVFTLKEKKLYKPFTLYYWFWSYLIIHIISLIWTNDMHFGLAKLHVYLPFATFSIAFCCFRLSKEELDNLLLLFFRVATLFIILSLFCWVYESHRLGVPLSEWIVLKKKTFISLPSFTYIYSWVGYNHPSYNSIGYVLAFVFGFYLFDKNTGRKISLFELIAFGISAFLLTCLVQSRIGVVNMIAIGGLGIVWLLRNDMKLLIGFLVICTALILAVATKYHEIFMAFITDAPREQLFDTAIAYIKTNPLWGTGIGGMTNVITSQELAHQLGYPFALVVNIYPHNQFLGDIMQTGILGLVALVGMLSYLIYTGIKQRSWLIIGFTGSFLLLMTIEMPFFLLKGTTPFVPFACLLLQYIHYKNKGHRHFDIANGAKVGKLFE